MSKLDTNHKVSDFMLVVSFLFVLHLKFQSGTQPLFFPELFEQSCL